MSIRSIRQRLSTLTMIFGVLAGVSQWVDAAESELNVLQPERNFGYTLGDVLVQQIVLPPSQGRPDLSVLNTAARVSDWLERQEATLIQQGNQRALRLQYQIVNAPQSIRFAELPASSLSLSDGATINWQAWPFSLGPLSAANSQDRPAQGDLSATLKADDELAPMDVQTPRRRLSAAAVFLGLLLLSWFAWWIWRSHLDRQRLPFARALHGLKKQRTGANPESLEAWRTVHEAFDATAGHVVTRPEVKRLLKRLPWLNRVEGEVDAFFAESSARFFSQPPQTHPFDLLGFTNRLARAEKRHAR